MAPRSAEQSDFDRTHGVETEGDFAGCTYLSDLDITSPNWIEGHNYVPIERDRFDRILNALDIPFEEYTFVDLGSGMGRALLLASEYPFKRIIGLEFSPQLHGRAEENIRRYRSPNQRCKAIQSRNEDLACFSPPPGPLVLYLFDPCQARILNSLLPKIGQSLIADPRPLFLVYVAFRPEHEEMFASAGYLKQISKNAELDYLIYQSQ
ncbi:MAG: class I SAM-dependent methyltransferase [Terriglobales bacterium]